MAKSRAVAAVGSAAFFINLGFGLNTIIVTGTGVKVAHRLGSKNYKEADEFINTGFLMNVILFLVYFTFLFLFRNMIVKYFNFNDAGVENMAKQYLMITGIGTFFKFSNFMFVSIFNSFGDSKTPFKINCIGVILNIFLDPLFIFVFNLGVFGAGLATMLCEGINSQVKNSCSQDGQLTNSQLESKQANCIQPPDLQVQTTRLPNSSPKISWGSVQLDGSRIGKDHQLSLSEVRSANTVGEFHLPQALLDFPPALVVTDVDSTLILEEVIDQLAAEAGVGEQVAKITAAAMRGEIDFTQSLHARVKTLAGLEESVFAQVFNQLHVTPGAKALVEWVHAHGGKFGVVSGGFTQIVQPLAKSLGIDYTLAIELEVQDGRLTGEVASPVVTAESKVHALKTWAKKMDEELSLPAGSSLQRTIAIGDGANDIPMLQTAALGIAFCAKPKVQDSVSSKLNVSRLDAVSWILEQIHVCK